MNIFKKGAGFLKEVKAELGKVSWSTREELLGSTAVVMIFTSIITVFIGIIDICFTKILSAIFKQ